MIRHDDKPEAQPMLQCQSAPHSANHNSLRLLMLQMLPPPIARKGDEVDVLLRVVHPSLDHEVQPNCS